MSILSQIGIIVLIVFIAVVLFFANKRIEKEAEQEEKFPESWEEYKTRMKKEPFVESAQEPVMVEKESTEELLEVVLPEEPVEEMQRTAHFVTLVHLNEQHVPMEEIEVKSLPFTIGRAGENSLVLNDLYVARQHCKIVDKNGQLVLQDLGTANKIIARGRCVEECLLEDGMRFYIGNEEFLVKQEQ